QIPATRSVHFHPAKILPGTHEDEIHVTGLVPRRQPVSGALEHLDFIYRVGEATAAEHGALFRRCLTLAYRKTQRRVSTSPVLRRLSPEGFGRASRAWDRAVAVFLKRGRGGGDPGWRAEADALLEAQGVSQELREEHLLAIEEHAALLERVS